MSSRTLTLLSKGSMRGNDAAAWERTLNAQLDDWSIDFRVPLNDTYDILDRSITSSVLYGLGIGQDEMAKGVTPELRIKVRNKRLAPAERARYHERSEWRARLRERLDVGETRVAKITNRVLADSWGYHPGVHDGMDIITPPNAALYACVRSRVIDVRAGGWWGKAPSGDVRLGDGIVQLEVLDDVGPFRRGMHLGYGHTEHATVRVGEIVEPGDQVGRAGLAVAWHTHWMVNGGRTPKGVGDRDPRPFYNYAQANG